MLGIFADVLHVATFGPHPDRNARLRAQLRQEDAEFLAGGRRNTGEKR